MTLSELLVNIQIWFSGFLNWLSEGWRNLGNLDIGELTIGQGFFTFYIVIYLLTLLAGVIEVWRTDRSIANMYASESEEEDFWEEHGPAIDRAMREDFRKEKEETRKTGKS